jgi:hypothetical protein
MNIQSPISPMVRSEHDPIPRKARFLASSPGRTAIAAFRAIRGNVRHLGTAIFSLAA